MVATAQQQIQWIDVVQLLSIVIGFGFTIRELRVSSKLRKFDVFWRITQSHREVWRPVVDDASLKRVLLEDVDLEQEPLTVQEEVFLNSVVLHVESVYEAHERGFYSLGKHVTKDIRDFFRLPLPALAWTRIKEYQTKQLLDFIDGGAAEATDHVARASVKNQRLAN